MVRKIDLGKHSVVGKAAKTINFDKIVLIKLESIAKRDGSKVSSIVNNLCRSKVLSDGKFYREMAKYHYLKFQEFNFMKDQTENSDIGWKGE